MSILIRDATVLTVDGDFRILDGGAVYVEDGRIADIGGSDEVAARRPSPDRVVEGRGKSHDGQTAHCYVRRFGAAWPDSLLCLLAAMEAESIILTDEQVSTKIREDDTLDIQSAQ